MILYLLLLVAGCITTYHYVMYENTYRLMEWSSYIAVTIPTALSAYDALQNISTCLNIALAWVGINLIFVLVQYKYKILRFN